MSSISFYSTGGTFNIPSLEWYEPLSLDLLPRVSTVPIRDVNLFRLSEGLQMELATYIVPPVYRIVNWIHQNNFEYIDFNILSIKPRSIRIHKKNLDKLYWEILSIDRKAFCKPFDTVDWVNLPPVAVSILEKNLDRIVWGLISRSLIGSPVVVQVLEENDNSEICIFEIDKKRSTNRYKAVLNRL